MYERVNAWDVRQKYLKAQEERSANKPADPPIYTDGKSAFIMSDIDECGANSAEKPINFERKYGDAAHEVDHPFAWLPQFSIAMIGILACLAYSLGLLSEMPRDGGMIGIGIIVAAYILADKHNR